MNYLQALVHHSLQPVRQPGDARMLSGTSENTGQHPSFFPRDNGFGEQHHHETDIREQVAYSEDNIQTIGQDVTEAVDNTRSYPDIKAGRELNSLAGQKEGIADPDENTGKQTILSDTPLPVSSDPGIETDSEATADAFNAQQGQQIKEGISDSLLSTGFESGQKDQGQYAEQTQAKSTPLANPGHIITSNLNEDTVQADDLFESKTTSPKPESTAPLLNTQNTQAITSIQNNDPPQDNGADYLSQGITHTNPRSRAKNAAKNINKEEQGKRSKPVIKYKPVIQNKQSGASAQAAEISTRAQQAKTRPFRAEPETKAKTENKSRETPQVRIGHVNVLIDEQAAVKPAQSTAKATPASSRSFGLRGV